MAKDKKEKLDRVNQLIEKENQIITKAKANTKKLKIEKRKLESQIANEESAQLLDVLSEYGIKTIEDFENFIDKNENSENQ